MLYLCDTASRLMHGLLCKGSRQWCRARLFFFLFISANANFVLPYAPRTRNQSQPSRNRNYFDQKLGFYTEIVILSIRNQVLTQKSLFF